MSLVDSSGGTLHKQIVSTRSVQH